MFIPQKIEGDILFYCSHSFYPFVRFFYTTYEWILFAKIKIREQTIKDVSKFGPQEAFKSLQPRLEEVIKERESIVYKALIAITQSNDSTQYEDLLRQTLGT